MKRQRAKDLSYPRLACFVLPMTLNMFMVMGTAPIITFGISWKFGAAGEEMHITAFFYTLSIAVFLFAHDLIARNIVIRTVADRKSLFKYAWFFLTWGIVAGVLIAIIARFDAIASIVITHILGAQPDIADLIREGLIIFSVVPLILLLRANAQACHIQNDQAWIVGAGSVCRLAAMALFVFGWAMHRESMTGPVMGAWTYTLGTGVETAFNIFMLAGKPQLQERNATKILSPGQFLKYSFPQFIGSVIRIAKEPLITAIISRCRLPGESLSSLSCVKSTMWLLLGMIMALEPAIINYATSKNNFHKVLIFGICLCSGITFFIFLVIFTPLQDIIYQQIMHVENPQILRLIRQSLFFFPFIPWTMLFSFTTAGLLVRSGTTGLIPIANLAGLVAVIVWAVVAGPYLPNGIIVGLIAIIVLQLTIGLVQSLGLRNNGFTRALLDRPLADVLVKK